jgi:molybdate transport system substrate-binding protein
MRAGALLLGMVLIALPACGDELRVGAASSLREVVAALVPPFEASHPGTEVLVSYGASSVLGAQLRAGAPLDVLLLADARLADDLARELGLTTSVPFARNRLVVMARSAALVVDNPAALHGPQVRRIAIPSAAVPIGRYAREWLERVGLLDTLGSRTVQTEHARATLLAVDNGHTDLAIVYTTDARLARHAVVALEISDEQQPSIAYVGIAGPGVSSSAAEAWLRFMVGPEATQQLKAAGFAAPALHGPR